MWKPPVHIHKELILDKFIDSQFSSEGQQGGTPISDTELHWLANFTYQQLQHGIVQR